MIPFDALRESRAMERALSQSPYPVLRPRAPAGASLLRLLDSRRQGYRLYEVFVLNQAIHALARQFAHLAWQPRFPPDVDVFLDRPYFRLPLPQSFGELVWQATYGRVAGLPVQSLSHVIRPDLTIERPGDLLILDAKYRRARQATIEILDDLHAYRDALVDGEGREVVRLAAAVTDAPPERSTRLYYETPFFQETGLGLVHLPSRSAGMEAQDDLLSLDRVLRHYFAA